MSSWVRDSIIDRLVMTGDKLMIARAVNDIVLDVGLVD